MAKMWLVRLLDVFLPRICVVCGERLTYPEEHFCQNCLRGLPATNFCKRPSDNYTYNLFKLQIPIERAVSFMRYMPESRFANIVKQMKYHGDEKLCVFMGRMMAEEIMAKGGTTEEKTVNRTSTQTITTIRRKAFFQGIDLIIPVPITKKRRRQRGYNQSELLAQGISEVTGIPMAKDAVRRTHFAESQTLTNRILRHKNVSDVFSCLHPERLAGKHILLIDDVITTGATLLSLAHCIEEKADGVRFSVLSLGITNELALM